MLLEYRGNDIYQSCATAKQLPTPSVSRREITSSAIFLSLYLGFQLCGLVGAAVAEKVRDYNAITTFGKVSDLMSPEIAGAWKAVKKEDVGLLVSWWYVDMTVSPSRG